MALTKCVAANPAGALMLSSPTGDSCSAVRLSCADLAAATIAAHPS